MTGRLSSGRDSGFAVEAGCWLERHSHVRLGTASRDFGLATDDRLSTAGRDDGALTVQQQHGPTGFAQQLAARFDEGLIADALPASDSIPPTDASTIKANRT
jgi:hypothetical protein